MRNSNKILSVFVLLTMVQTLSAQNSELAVGTRVTFQRQSFASTVLDKQQLTIIERNGDEFVGLIQEVGNIWEQFGMSRQVADRAVGTLSKDGDFRLHVEKTRLEKSRPKSGWAAAGTWGATQSLTWGRKLESRKPSLFVIHQQKLHDAELKRFVETQSKAIELGEEQYAKHAPLISRLKRKGHELTVIGILETGDLDLIWSDYGNGTYKNGRYIRGRGEYVRDYKMLEELIPLGHINVLSIDHMKDLRDLEHLSKLKSVGQIGLPDKIQANHLESLSRIQNLTFLDLKQANEESLRQVATLKNLRGLRIWFSQRSKGIPFESSWLRPLSEISNLERLILIAYDRNVKDAIHDLRACKQLKSISLSVSDISDRSIDAIAELPKLESLLLQRATPKQLWRIKNNAIKRITIEYVSRYEEQFTDAGFARWDYPDSLESLKMNYWAPEPLVSYIKRLKGMNPREHALYLTTRTLIDTWSNFRRSSFARQEANILVYGGGLVQSVRDVERPRVYDQTLNALRQLRATRDSYVAFLETTGEAAQQGLETLLDEGLISLPCAIHTQIAIYRFSGRIASSLEDKFDATRMDSLKKGRKWYLDELYNR